MDLLSLFPHRLPIMAMLHLKGQTPGERLERAKLEADVLMQNGADAVIVEDYFGDLADVRAVLAYLQVERPHYCCGVNYLDHLEESYLLAEEFGAKFIQADSVAGHLTPEDDVAFGQMCERYHRKGNVAVMGGVRFKYQPYLSGRSLEEDLALAQNRCDAVVVTGVATGAVTDLDKIKEFRGILGEFPLIIGAGLTAENCAEQLAFADGCVVGSTLKDTRKDTGDVSAAHVRVFADAVAKLR